MENWNRKKPNLDNIRLRLFFGHWYANGPNPNDNGSTAATGGRSGVWEGHFSMYKEVLLCLLVSLSVFLCLLVSSASSCVFLCLLVSSCVFLRLVWSFLSRFPILNFLFLLKLYQTFLNSQLGIPNFLYTEYHQSYSTKTIHYKRLHPFHEPVKQSS